MSSPNPEEELIPELGDLITLISTNFGRLTGTIIYRDSETIRVQSFSEADRAHNVSMDIDGDFHKEAGIIKLIIHKKREDPHFSLQLGVIPGEYINCYGIGGQPLEGGRVAEVIATEDEDAIVLETGVKLNFAFIGPPDPIQVIFVTATADDQEEALPAENAPPDYYDISAILGDVLPAAMVEDVPTAERTYSENVQREDMYVDLLKEFSEAKQKNPKIQRKLARETELLLALKSAATTVSSDGKSKPYSKSAESLRDIVSNSGSALAAIIPVLSAKRILYVEIETEEELEAEKAKQVDIRPWIESELKSWKMEQAYTAGQDSGQMAKQSIQMYTYLYKILNNESAVLLPNDDSEIETVVDQDVLRTVAPPTKLYGFSKLVIDKDTKVSQENIGKISSRQIRVLSSYKTVSGSVISPGDPGSVASYILLPGMFGFSCRPVKFSGFLAEDIRAAESLKQLPPFETLLFGKGGLKAGDGYKIFDNSAGSDALDKASVSDWVNNNLASSVHPSDLLSCSSVGVNRILDSIGLRSYEWTPELSEVIWTAVKKAQATYIKMYDKFLESVEVHIKGTKPYEFGSGIPDTSPIFTQAVKLKEIGEALAQMALHNPTNYKWDLAQAQYIYSKAEGCLTRLFYLSQEEIPHPELAYAIADYKQEISRKMLHSLEYYNSLSKYKGEPVINTCPHCKDLDTIRSVMMYDESKFIKLLGDFLARYQGDRKANWVQCKVCQLNLICIHEVMKFYEKTHPGRSPALSKEILLDFGGAAFNGRYVCKNCGIPIAEFEYDNHLEYDDEGRPLAGRAPVEEGKTSPEDELTKILDMAMNKETVKFDDPVKTQLYEIISILTLNTGFMFNLDTIKSLVDKVYIYETTTLQSETEYEAIRARSKKKASMPLYESFKSTIEIAFIAAILLCEIHTMEPLPELVYPFAGCNFSRGGYPIETDDVSVNGAFEYIVCVIANMNRDQRPWNITDWWGESSPEDRKVKVRNWIGLMLKEPPIAMSLQTAKEKYLIYKKESALQATASDIIPAHFRPTSQAMPPDFDITNIAVPKRLVDSVSTAPIGEIEPVIKERAYQLAVTDILRSHIEAKETGMINPASQRSESNCRFLSISDIKHGSEAERESADFAFVETVLHKRDPNSQSNGGHLWVRWTPPEPTVSIPVAPDASYFKLFMRTCFKGQRAGEIHEFGKRLNGKDIVYECRHCKFQAQRDPLVLMSDLNDEELYNSNTKRKGPPSTKIQDEARAVLAASGVAVDASTFDELLNTVCRKQTVDPYVVPRKADSRAIITELMSLINDGTILTPTRLQDLGPLNSILEGLFTLSTDVPEDRRIIIWAKFSSIYDEIKTRIIEILDSGREVGRGKAKVGKEVVDAIEKMTEEPLFKGPAEINKNWIVGLERLGTNFGQMVFGGSWFGFPYEVRKLRKIKSTLFGGLKWFGKQIKEKHTAKFENMIETILGSTNDAVTALNRASIQSDSAMVLKKLASWFGKLNSLWISNINSVSIFGVTNIELSNILRWILLSSIESLLTISSPLYTPITTEPKKLQIKNILSEWTKSAFLDGGKSYDLFGMSDEAVEAAILDLREKEKISIIKEIDDIKDPDEKAAMMLQKRLGLGRWAVGTTKGGEFNAEYWNFLQGQRDRIGVYDEFGGQRRENAVGYDFAEVPQGERGYATYAGQDEDAFGGE